MTEPAERQQTVATTVRLEGTGLHSGKPVHLSVEPGGPDTGFVFVRSDLEGSPELPATRETVLASPRGTRIRRGEVEVQTVEHLLAAATGLGFDNLRLVMDAPEPPAMDGSAAPFATALEEAGRREQDAARPLYRVLFPVSYQEGDVCITAVPADELRVSSTIAYPGTAIGFQSFSLVVTPESFRRELARARTFCLRSEVERMREAGLALGGSLDNAVVVEGDEILNEQGLRWPDEFVRHKILDLVGDMSVAGARIHGHFVAHKSGHVQNIRLLEKLFDDGALAAAGPVPSAPMGFLAISRLLPHRYPFLLVDRIEELEVGRRAVGYKCVTIDEPFFQGHFPGRPVMPGVLIMEALAQVAGVTMLSRPDLEGKFPFFTGLDRVVFRRSVHPGDLLRLEVEIERTRLNMGRARAVAKIDDQVAASGQLKFTLLD